jgi:hypothetical protein
VEDLLNQALLLFGNAVLATLAIVLGWATNWIAKKVKSEHWAGVISRTDDLVMKIVRDLTTEEKEAAKAAAMAQLKGYLGVKGLKEVASLVSDGKLDDYLSGLIENAVANSKNSGKLARRPVRPRRPAP